MNLIPRNHLGQLAWLGGWGTIIIPLSLFEANGDHWKGMKLNAVQVNFDNSVPLRVKLQQTADHWERMELNAVRVHFDNSVLETE